MSRPFPVWALSLVFAVAFPVAAFSQDEPALDDEEKKEETLPLEASDTIEFTTDEGTWMSLDVSSDGETIVFDLLGDVYTLPIGGGDAAQIVGGISFEAQPRFSPDGETIVFVSDRSGADNLWLADADGSNPRALTKGRHQHFISPSWTSDGDYVIASRSGNGINTYSLRMYHKDGGSGIDIGPPPPPPPSPGSDGPRPTRQNKLGGAAAPDGRYIYYAQRNGLFNYNATFPIWQIVRFDRETSETSTLTNAQGSAMRPLLSPDGRYLVYATRFETGTGLRVRDLETSEERWLAYPVTRDDQESVASRDTMPGYAFMPDGESLIVPVDGKIKRVDFFSGEISDISFTAEVKAEIGPRVIFESRIEDSDNVRARLIRWTSLSPDGKRVVFTALNKIWIMDVPLGTPERLTDSEAGEFMPTWSPDGEHVAYATWSSQGGHIFRVAADRSDPPEQLTSRPAYYSDPVYSPDGEKIVFISGSTAGQLFSDLQQQEPDLPYDDGSGAGEIGGIPRGSGLDLRWIPSSGGDSTLIAGTQGGRFPHFTSDPERVYFTSNSGLGSLRLDGLDRKTHFRISGTGAGPNKPTAEQIHISPDGMRAFVSLQNKHYLISVPSAGKETIRISIAGEDSANVPVTKLSAEGGDYLGWSKDGEWLTWALGDTFYRRRPDSAFPEVSVAVIEATRARPSGSVVLRGASIITMRDDQVIKDGEILVTANRIVGVGARGTLPVPAGTEEIEVSGKFIIPGLVDTHAHMWAPRGVHQTQVWQYLANLAYGVTTTRDPQTSTTDVFSYSDLVETGEILGPRVFATGPGVFSRSGLDDKEATRDFIMRYKEAYRTPTIKAYMSGDRIVRQWVIMAAREFGIMPTTEGGLDMKLDLSQMSDGFTGLEHSLPIQPLYNDVARFVAGTRTFYTPTTLVAYGAPWTENHFFETTDVHGDMKLRRFIPHELLDSMVRRRGQWFLPEEYGHKGIAKGVADIVAAGGRAGVGSHGQMQGIGYHWELWSMQSGGMPNHDALRVATIFGAEAIGYRQDVGSLEAGKLADLVVLDRNPLEDIRNTNSIRYVMKNGEIFEGDTLDQIWPEEKKLPEQYWWNQDPK